MYAFPSESILYRCSYIHTLQSTLLQFVLWNIFQVLCVCWLMNLVLVFTFLQHIFPAFDLYSLHLPSFKAFKSFLALPFSIQCVRIISWMVLFPLNAVIRGGSRFAAPSKMECFVIKHKALHLGCCSSPRSVSGYWFFFKNFC